MLKKKLIGFLFLHGCTTFHAHKEKISVVMLLSSTSRDFSSIYSEHKRKEGKENAIEEYTFFNATI